MGKRKSRHERSRSSSRSCSRSYYTEVENRLKHLEQALHRSRSRTKSRSSRATRTHNSSRSRDRSRSRRSNMPLQVSTREDIRSLQGHSSIEHESNSEHDFSMSLERSPVRGTAGQIETDNVEADVLLLNEALDIDLLNTLGEDPQTNMVKKIDFHPALASRWGNILANGLDKSVKLELLGKYPAPSNLDVLVAPELNLEIKQVISPNSVKRDKYQVLAQSQLGCAITALGISIEKILKDNNEFGKILLPNLSDVGKLLNDLHHNFSLSRRYLILPQVTDKTLKQVLVASKPDTKLFGADFNDSYKAAKELERNTKILKSVPPAKQREQTLNIARTPSQPVKTFERHLNYKGPFRSWRETKHQGPKFHKYKTNQELNKHRR